MAACQLVHLGRETTGAEMWFAPVAPSAVRSPREPTRPRVLTDDEVDAVIEGFRVSAVNAGRAGFQVIELHAAHGYLLGAVPLPVTNLRPDGGSPAERARIVARIADAIRGCGARAADRHPALDRGRTRRPGTRSTGCASCCRTSPRSSTT